MSDSATRKPRSGHSRHWPLSLDRMERPTKAAGMRAMTTADAQTLRPQRPLSDALREANRVRSAPANHSDLQAFRQNMVLRLRQAGCRDEGVLAAMNAVPRHLFVDSALATQAYEDTSLPIGLGQTISKPSVVARMIELLRQRPGGLALERVLEIGTGCGYQAAVLAHVAGRTISIERLRGLHDRAQRQLAPLQLPGITLVYGDGRLGHAPAAPYDGIIAAAGGRDLPGAWLEQLARGGRLVAPVQDPALGTQVLMVIDKLADGSIVQRIHEAVRFVPLESGTSDFGLS
ncbi:protein-L-isoaspartate(D-aspartate) O-methyltransferase [Sphaerotilus sp.]|jgi:protein-L-isoaspartate(D-aspartate) O-methyltransferase|uniref:protein-L-isoaspartate(D-aspartate) O-methyltransferase n=1 Tax=Sphaerotilus sp. TaxID=2093942 RepID=UPI0025EDAAFD|nr:protein-L-isoaspartate(D-aspartate) O-methyltransferase [Sphaerotilus sp.]